LLCLGGVDICVVGPGASAPGDSRWCR
jgi:hypothetical protein